jgi:hypothetical protein
MAQNSDEWLKSVQSDPLLELIWRTHLLYPAVYAQFSHEMFSSDVLVNRASQDPSLATRDVKPSMDAIPTTGGDGQLATCYCWICERIKDEIPEFAHLLDMAQQSAFSRSPDVSTAGNGSALPLRSSSESTYDANLLAHLSKDQLTSIKSDVAFYRYVESFRQTHPPGTTLPTRPPTVRDLERQKLEQESKDRAGRYYGMGYLVKVDRPAIYDPDTGKLVKREKVKITRDKSMLATQRFLGVTMGI